MSQYDFKNSDFAIRFNSNINVGDIVEFGRYRQKMKDITQEEAVAIGDAEEWFDIVPIEWRVLAKKDNRALLISKESLDAHPYCQNKESEWIGWEKSEVRSWLNTYFYTTAFSCEEQKRIVPVTLQTCDNPVYQTYDRSKTKDKVFILDTFEAERYFKSAAERFTWINEYAFIHGAYGNPKNKRCLWRLRTLGKTALMTAVVDDIGEIDYYGDSVFADYVAIRPAVWVTLNA